ncbi:MAG: gliding motility-associated C-terminal domain-containing protein, partial [Saprospiraceae bacterium]|nr:gliding motility-associated C-terminal domain-containing protein [Saprospiraceae bacterium]
LLNCLNASLAIQGSGSSGPGFTIQWTASPGFIVSGANTFTPTVNQAGTYILTVTNTANGCTSEDVVTVDANFDQPEAIIQPPLIIDCYSPTVDLDGGSSTQGGEIQYNWTTSNGNIVSGSTSPYPTVNQGGTYTLVVTNTLSGCKATATVTVIKNTTPPLANAGPGGILNCNIAQLTLNGTGSSGSNFFYEWNTSNGNIVSGENTLNPVIDAPGTYFLVVTNGQNGCTTQSSVTINADQNAPVAYAGGDQQLSCLHPSVTLTGSGSSTGAGISYQWVANPGNIVSGATTLNNVVVNSAGFYTLIVTNNSNGCTDESEVYVEDNIIYPVADILPAQQLNCTFSSVQLDGGGSTQGNNIDYTWTTTNGNILYGNGTPYPEVDEVGTYNLLVVNSDNSCTATASVTVTQDIVPPVATAVAAASITCQSPQTQLNGNGSSSGYPFFYEWTTTNGNIVSGALTLTPMVNQVGTYVLTVFNVENGCTAQSTVQVTTSQTFPTVSAGPAQTITCTNAQLSLNGAGSSQGPLFTYVWSTQNGNIVSGINSLTPVVNAPGSYELTVINTQTGCTSVASVSVGIDITAPQAAVAPGGELSCTQTTLLLDGSGSSTGMQYDWSTPTGTIVAGAQSLNPQVSATGTYTLVVTNTTNGCSASASTLVTADASLPTANAGLPTTLNCVVTQFNLDATASSQGAQFDYQWQGPGIVSGDTTLTPLVNAAGLYELLITNTVNGCTAISSVNVPADLAFPNVDAGPGLVLNCTNTTVTLLGNQSDSTLQCEYGWYSFDGGNIVSGATTLSPVIDGPGSFVITATNFTNGCVDIDTVVVTQDIVLPVANAGAPGLITCTNSTVTLSGTGSAGPLFTYLWTTPTGSISAGPTTLSPVVDAPGTYNLLVTNTENGCTATASVLVDKDANVPTAVVQAPAELNCSVLQLDLNGIGSTSGAGVQYQWTTLGGNIVAGESTLTPQINAPGQYILNVLNTNNNCDAQFSVQVNQNLTPPNANAGAPAVLSCANPVLSLNGAGSSLGSEYTYQWSGATGGILQGDTTLTPQVDQSGFYTLVVTDNQNHCTASATVQILLDQNSPQAEAGPQQAITCTVSNLTLNTTGSSVNPGFTYQWTASGGGNISSGADGLSPVVDAPGTYTLLITNPSNGCTSLDSVAVVVDQVPPIAVVANPPTLNCQLTQTTLNTAGSSQGGTFTYKWTTTGGNILSGANSPAPVVNKPGTYQLVLTNTTNGCTTTSTTVVSQDIVGPVVDAGSTAELNCVTTALSLIGTTGSVGPNVQYAWTTSTGNIVSGANTLTPVVNSPGVYVLIVTNLDNQCSATDQVPVSQNINLPSALAAAGPTLTCATPTAALNANGSSAGPLFSYDWLAQNGGNILSGANTLVPTINAPGLYILTVTNTNNQCSSTATVTVDQDITPPAAIAGNTVTLTCTSPNLQLNGAGSSVGSTYTYAWTTIDGSIVSGENTLQPVIDLPGLYTLVVSSQTNGCTKESSVQVLQDANAPLAAAATPGELTCDTKTLVLSGAGSSVGNSFEYLWSTTNGQITSGNTSLSPSVSQPGVYNLLVTNDLNGCTQTATITVTQNINPPDINASAPGPITCAIPQLTLISAGSGSGQGVEYAWSTSNGVLVSGSNSANPLVSAGGLYQVTVTDVYNGCTNTAQVTVLTDTQAPPVAIAAPGLLTCVVFTVQLNANASAQGSQYGYSWSGPGIIAGGNTLTPEVNQPGAYSLQIINATNGCSATAQTQVPQNIQAPVAEAGDGFEMTCSVTESVLSATGSSTGANMAYAWSTSDGHFLSATNIATPTADEPGLYVLLVTNTTTGCTATDQVVVTENTNYPSALELATVLPGCGGKPGSILFEEVQGGVGPYLYSIDNGNTFLTASQFGGLTPGQYPLVVQDVNGCEYAEMLNFPVPVEPQVLLDPEITLAYGASATLVAQINIPLALVDSIIWTPLESLTTTTKPNVVIAQPFAPTLYTVTIVNKEGCTDKASILVRVEDPNIWAPNAISPNREDGQNDVFLIFAGEGTVRKINSLQIYDRWGNQVFFKTDVQPNDEKHGWNGRFRGEAMNPAVFVWWAEIELLSGQKILMKGDVTIVD